MIKIWPEGEVPGFNPEFGQPVPTLDPYLVTSDNLTPAMVICPGGAYISKADHEGKEIAKWFNTIGVSAFVLDYRTTPYKHPCPLMDAQRAIQFVRAKADQFNIDPNKVGITGFSAGGHLAASAATYFLRGNGQAEDPISRISSRPDCAVLGYPVISMEKFHHQNSRDNLLGSNPDSELVHKMSLENNAHQEMSPVFMWHTASDQAVPVENSLMFASALSKAKVHFGLHVFPHGRHGLGLASEQKDAAIWPDLLGQWLIEIGFRGE